MAPFSERHSYADTLPGKGAIRSVPFGFAGRPFWLGLRQLLGLAARGTLISALAFVSIAAVRASAQAHPLADTGDAAAAGQQRIGRRERRRCSGAQVVLPRQRRFHNQRQVAEPVGRMLGIRYSFRYRELHLGGAGEARRHLHPARAAGGRCGGTEADRTRWRRGYLGARHRVARARAARRGQRRPAGGRGALPREPGRLRHPAGWRQLLHRGGGAGHAPGPAVRECGPLPVQRL